MGGAGAANDVLVCGSGELPLLPLPQRTSAPQGVLAFASSAFISSMILYSALLPGLRQTSAPPWDSSPQTLQLCATPVTMRGVRKKWGR